MIELPPDAPTGYGNCPTCDAHIRFGKPRLEVKDSDPNPRFLLCCNACASFLTWRNDAFVLLTIEEIAALPDEIRNMMLRQRRDVENRVPFEVQCPMCGTQFQLAERKHRGQAVPGPGDCCVCGNCAMPLVIQEDRTLRPVNREEWRMLPDDVKRDFVARARELCMAFKPEAWAELEARFGKFSEPGGKLDC